MYPASGNTEVELQSNHSIKKAIPMREIRQGKTSVLLRRLSRGRGAMALTDQVMVSASNFAASVVLVRGLGLSEFGKYSIAYILLLYANALQMSFVASPMLNIAPLLPDKEKRQFVQGMLAVQVLASMLLFVVFALAGTISHAFTNFYSFPCIFAFACCTGTFQLQDWLRRYYFLYNKGRLAIISDFISYTVQLVILFVFWKTGSLTLFRTFMVMFGTSVVAFAMGPITDELRPAMGRLRETWSRCRHLSRDLLIANQIRWFGVQGVFLIGTGIVGTAAAGGLRATANLAGPVYLVLNSLENIIPMRIAEEIKKKGAEGAYSFIKRAIFGGTLFFGLLILPVGVFGRPILRLLYGPAMVAFYLPMLLQLTSIVIQIASILWFHFYRSIQDTRALVRANVISAITSVATVYLFGHLWKAPGIVLSSLLGQTMIVLYSMLHWHYHRKHILLRHPSMDLIDSNAPAAAPEEVYPEMDLVSSGKRKDQ
jgi:O-antigen/teichoic acid export membrane protein